VPDFDNGYVSIVTDRAFQSGAVAKRRFYDDLMQVLFKILTGVGIPHRECVTLMRTPYDGQWHVERKVVEGRTGDTKTAARQEGVPIIPYLQKITDKYWKSVGCPAEGAVFGRWMNNLKRDHITPQLKKKGMKWNGWHAFRRGLATNLHEMGVPTKVIQRVCRHADEATTKKHYIHATEPGVRSGMRKLEASIIREKHERR
jgi:integrase